MFKILIVDDDADLVDWLGYSYRREGYTVSSAYNGEMALKLFETESPDIIILDLMLPKRSGLEVLKEIRARSQTPVILLTAVGDENSAVKGLKSGADDYVVKPFRPRELRARTEALLRRSKGSTQDQSKPISPLTCGEIYLDPRTREVTVAGRPVKLTRNEFNVLEYLVLNQNTIMHIDNILMSVWGYDSDQDEDVVRVTISRLRRKIELDPSRPRYIINLPGEGYMAQSGG